MAAAQKACGQRSWSAFATAAAAAKVTLQEFFGGDRCIY